MNVKDLKNLMDDQNKIRAWLRSINETDNEIVNEVMELMRTKPDYREWIVNYALPKTKMPTPSH